MEIEYEKKYMTSVGSSYVVDIWLTGETADACYHPGPCDYDVAFWVNELYIQEQLKKYTDKEIADAIEDAGWGYDDDIMKDRKLNEQRLIWFAAGNIIEGDCEEYNN